MHIDQICYSQSSAIISHIVADKQLYLEKWNWPNETYFLHLFRFATMDVQYIIDTYFTMVIANDQLYRKIYHVMDPLHNYNNNDFAHVSFFEKMKVTHVACGRNHIAVIADNQLYTYGMNYNGQLGHGNLVDEAEPRLVQGLDNVTFVSCGILHTVVIANGKAYGFGSNKHYSLGLKTSRNLIIPTPLGFENVTHVKCRDHVTAIVTNNCLYAFGHFSCTMSLSHDEESRNILRDYNMQSPKFLGVFTHVDDLLLDSWDVYIVSNKSLYKIDIQYGSIHKFDQYAYVNKCEFGHKCLYVDGISKKIDL